MVAPVIATISRSALLRSPVSTTTSFILSGTAAELIFEFIFLDFVAKTRRFVTFQNRHTFDTGNVRIESYQQLDIVGEPASAWS